MKRCEAVVKTDDGSTQCTANAVGSSAYCRKHNEALYKVTTSHKFEHGLLSPFKKRFSRVNETLLSRINELRDDPDLWSLRDDAAFITALMDLRAESITEGISLDHYNDLVETVNTLKGAVKSGDFDRVSEVVNILSGQVSKGRDAFDGANEVIKLIEKRTDIIETEQRMMHAKAYTIEVDQAYSLIMQVFGVIKKHIKNAEELKAIRGGIGQILRTYQDDDNIIDVEVVDEVDSQHTSNPS
jgi:hypothetical protein